MTQRVFTSISDATRSQIASRVKTAQNKHIFRRLKWAAVDKNKISKLVADVHFLIRELWNILDPWRHEELVNSTRAMMSNIITLNDRFDQLMSLKEASSPSRPAITNLQDSMTDSLAVSAEVKALRIGLDNHSQSSVSDSESNVPKRQILLQKLER